MLANRNLVAKSLLFFLIAFLGQTSAQDYLPTPDFGRGALEEAAPEMETLLQLEWDDGKLKLRRDWEERLKAKRKEDGIDEGEKEEMVEKLVEQGLPADEAEKMAEQLLERDINPFDRRRNLRNLGGRNNSALDKAFFAIASKNGSRSSGSSGSNERRQLRFSSQSLAGETNLNSENIQFKFTELDGNQRDFVLTDNGEGKLKFEFTFDELYLRFLQKEEGRTQLICIVNDKAYTYAGDSFSDFEKRNPQVAEELLFPLLDRFGIKKPIRATDPDVLSNAIARLQNLAGANSEELERLLEELGSKNYQTRIEASEALSEGYDQWSARIKEYSTNPELSVEARFRLKEIIDSQVESEASAMITNERLLESPEFLVTALEFADAQQKTLVVKQLEKVTGESHGTNVEAWKDWLETNK